MNDEDEIEWEYEDESDTADDGDVAGPRSLQVLHAELRGSPDDTKSTSEEEDAVDWEHVNSQPCQDEEMATTSGCEPGNLFGDINSVDWEHINSVLEREVATNANELDGLKLQKKVVRMTKKDKEQELALHKAHLLLSLSTLMRMNALCQSRLLRGLLLSLCSEYELDFLKAAKAALIKYRLELLVRWFNGHFRPAEDSDRVLPLEPSVLTENALLRVVWNRQGHRADLALLFTIACRAIGLETRLVATVDPFVVRHRNSAAENVASIASLSRFSHRDARTEVRLETPHQIRWVWCEVLNNYSGNWIALDSAHRQADQSQFLERVRGLKVPLSYVFAVEEDGFMTDVSPRYVSYWSKVMHWRLGHDWIARTLQGVNALVSGGEIDLPLQELRESEHRKLWSMIESEDMPTSIEGFKKHHLYCLERHLGQFECVHPRKAVAVFKGHTIYPRKCVQTVRTWFQWRRLGRNVKENEKDRPARWRKFNYSKKLYNDCEEREAESRDCIGRALYGYWQTEQVVVQPVDGATVPKNKYGNIELWSPGHLPTGALHLRLPRIDKVADQIGVDYARAVVGFETKNGVRHPQFDGIVVSEVVVEPLLDAHAQLQQSLIERAITKNQLLVVNRWERLVKRIVLKKRLNDEYGEV